ncbi:MAG: helix-turn-helix transcriptional regulator [Bacilli bacterium]|nr:helix-turn-helix transcriptional regulator [Bacilli bacterium]MBR3119740.1 helix-turn-helix transcriptional regulator [Oceanobacillus sp.]
MSSKQLNRETIYNDVLDIFENENEDEVFINTAEIAKKYGVKGPTVDYHIKNLVNEGRLLLSNKRGKYNRKFYYLPDSKQEALPDKKIFTSGNIDQYRTILQEKMKDFSNVLDTVESNSKNEEQQGQQVEEVEQEAPVKENVEDEIKTENKQVEHIEEPAINEEESDNQKEFVPQKSIDFSAGDLNLDDKIQLFLKQSSHVPTPENLLTHQDREVLAVMNESIHQNIIYLKDLSEQLSTIQNKELIQQLIDERNIYLEEKTKIQEENEILRSELENNRGKFDLDPKRIRLAQQNIISVLDSFLDQPNHALALSRIEFRNTITKLINDAFRYVLNLEK